MVYICLWRRNRLTLTIYRCTVRLVCYSDNLRGRDHLEDLHMGGWIMLKLTLNHHSFQDNDFLACSEPANGRWRQHVSLKRLSHAMSLHSDVSQKAVIFLHAAVRT
jgi:hypothetical protein